METVIVILKKHKWIWMIFLLFFISDIIAYIVFVHGADNKILELQNEYSETRRNDVNSGSNNPRLNQNQLSIEDIKRFKKILPFLNEFPQQVGLIYDIVDKNNIDLSSVNFHPEFIQDLSIWRYTTKFTMKGDYQSLRKAISDIQNSRYLFCIEQISLENKDKMTSMVNLSLKLAIYFNQDHSG